VNPARTLTLYHGTSTVFADEIERDGLRDPYLAAEPELAEYYAEEAVEAHGGEELVLKVSLKNTRALRYDGAAMDEPVMASEEERDEAWEEAGRKHPEWIVRGYIDVPRTAWRVSYDGVGSVRYEGTLKVAGGTGKLVANADRETFAEQIARMRREREAHIERVRAEVERTGAYVVQVTDANPVTDYPGGWQTITRSTRPGIAWQVTSWQGDPRGPDAIPTGHIDIVGSIEDAAKEVRPRVR
jgi:hypothetical protein